MDKNSDNNSRLISIIAHDVKAPLAGFVSLTADLLENFDLFDKDEINEYVSVMHTASVRLYGLFNNLLEWALLQNGGGSFNPADLNLYSEVENIVKFFSDTAANKSISIKNDIYVYMFVYADKNMVASILRNLISNAIKFSQPGGTITLSACYTGQEVEISVADTGIGMKKELIEKILKADSWYSDHGTAGEQGTGLGLTLCREMVEKHGGTLSISSSPEQGTNVLFKLPAGPETH